MRGWAAVGVLLRIIANETEKERERRHGAVRRRNVDDREVCFAFPMSGTRRGGRTRSRAGPREVQKAVAAEGLRPSCRERAQLLFLTEVKPMGEGGEGWHQMPDFFIVVVIIFARTLSATRMPRPANTLLIVSTACFMLRADPCSSVIRAMAISLATLSTSSTMRNTSMAKATGLSLRAAQTDASQYHFPR